MDRRARETLRKRLLEKLRGSFIYSDEPLYTLSSGRKSRFYIDCKRVTLDPEGAFLTGQLLLDAVSDIEIQAIGGMTLGADPLAVSAAVLSYGTDRVLRAFLVRKDPAGFNESPFLEGNLTRGTRVAVVDDVLTGGRSIQRVGEILKESGHHVVRVVALVDRREGGREHLEGLGYEVKSLFNLEDLLTS